MELKMNADKRRFSVKLILSLKTFSKSLMKL